MIKTFETKCLNILEANSKDLTSVLHTSTEESKKVENTKNTYTENYYLDRKSSNTFVNTVKIVVFAVGLSLLNPISADAKEINKENEQATLIDSWDIVGNVYIGGIILTFLGLSNYIIKLKKRNKEQSYTIKLSDDTHIDEEEAIKHIKIICK